MAKRAQYPLICLPLPTPAPSPKKKPARAPLRRQIKNCLESAGSKHKYGVVHIYQDQHALPRQYQLVPLASVLHSLKLEYGSARCTLSEGGNDRELLNAVSARSAEYLPAGRKAFLRQLCCIYPANLGADRMAEAERLPQDHAALRSPRDAALQMREIGIRSHHIWYCSRAPAPQMLESAR